MLKAHSPMIMVNLCMPGTDISRLISNIRSDFPGTPVITTPNKGRDIGGKLALINFFIQARLQAEYIVFLHDKQSNYWFAGEAWRQKLFAIIEPEKVKVILEKFAQSPMTGIIGKREFIRNEYDEKINEFKTTKQHTVKGVTIEVQFKSERLPFCCRHYVLDTNLNYSEILFAPLSS